ncbi:MAG: dynamin family protein [Microbacter sp.]
MPFIADLIRINKLTGAPELTRPVEMLLNGQQTHINIAVLGQFKTGKSSLINSLLDSDILPVGVVPLTAIVTQVIFGDEASIHLKFKDGKEMTLVMVNSTAMTEVTLSTSCVSCKLAMCSEVMTNKQNPNKLADVLRICCDV